MVRGSGLGDSYNENGPSLSSRVQVLKLSIRKQSSYMKDNTRVYSETTSKLHVLGKQIQLSLSSIMIMISRAFYNDRTEKVN